MPFRRSWRTNNVPARAIRAETSRASPTKDLRYNLTSGTGDIVGVGVGSVVAVLVGVGVNDGLAVGGGR